MQVKLYRDITFTINAPLCSVRNVFKVLCIFLHIIFGRWQYCNVNNTSCTQSCIYKIILLQNAWKSKYYYWTHIIHCISSAMGNVCFLSLQLIIQHWHISFRLICKIHFQHGENSYTGVMDAFDKNHGADMWNVKAALCKYYMYFKFSNIICIVFTSNYIN